MIGSKKLLILISIVLIASVFYIKLRDINLVLYENYVAENNDNRTVYEYNDEVINLRLRWLNAEVTEGPYKLFFSIEVKDDTIENIYIKNIDITSSEKKYQFTRINSEPLLIFNIDKKDAHLDYHHDNDRKRYYEFEDRFNFDFDNKEEFTLNINLSYQGEDINEERQLEVRYIPYLQKVYASMY